MTESNNEDDVVAPGAVLVVSHPRSPSDVGEADNLYVRDIVTISTANQMVYDRAIAAFVILASGALVPKLRSFTGIACPWIMVIA